MRLDLPHQFPDVEIPASLAARITVHRAPYDGLPGQEVRVLLDNGYGLNLLYGRGYSTDNTVEALVFTHHGDPDDWQEAPYVIHTNSTPGLQGWANAVWLAFALTALAALPDPDQPRETTP